MSPDGGFGWEEDCLPTLLLHTAETLYVCMYAEICGLIRFAVYIHVRAGVGSRVRRTSVRELGTICPFEHRNALTYAEKMKRKNQERLKMSGRKGGEQPI